ncbi:hypothetical protein D8674_011605 [Pyrus ussuriensis x Pyrus communis]|uniref:Uncharacterized protein n=1 Tax=Pyrus ussuriensis x Pyrus communis TaxID=2448454 RepID=A0A5N5G004_9ROSA|nr:hypothetical protein D8674_011605 [Pyrus ussuriensis x Pyrus communis]
MLQRWATVEMNSPSKQEKKNLAAFGLGQGASLQLKEGRAGGRPSSAKATGDGLRCEKPNTFVGFWN